MGKPTVDPGGESQQDRFAKLIRQHYQELYRAAYRLTRSSVDAEDLVQEVCLRAYPRLTEVEALEQPRSWMLRVLYRLFVDLRRRYERKNVRAIDENEEFKSNEPSPAEEADRALDRLRIEDAWRHLNDGHRLPAGASRCRGVFVGRDPYIDGHQGRNDQVAAAPSRVRLGRLLRRDRAVTSAVADERGS